MEPKEYAKTLVAKHGITKSLIICDAEILRLDKDTTEPVSKRDEKKWMWDIIKKELQKLSKTIN